MQKPYRRGLQAGEVRLVADALEIVLAHGLVCSVKRTKHGGPNHCSVVVSTYSMEAGRSLHLELVRRGFVFIWTEGRGNSGSEKTEIEIVCTLHKPEDAEG